MRKILALAATALVLSTVHASAFDLKRLSDKLFDCDGVAVKFASHLTDEASPESESRGYAMLDLVELVVMPEGEANGALSGFARKHLDAAKNKASAKAQEIVDECGIGGTPAGTVANPFAD